MILIRTATPYILLATLALAKDPSFQVRFPHALPGKSITITKAFDPKTGRARLISSDPNIRSFKDLVALEDAEREIVRKKYGRMHPDLASRLSLRTTKARYLVRFKAPEGVQYLDRTKHNDDDLRRNSIAVGALKPVHNIPTVLSIYGIDAGTELNEFVSIVAAMPAQVLKLAMDADVADIEEYNEAQTVNSVPLSLVGPMAFSAVNSTDDLGYLARSAYSHTMDPFPAGIANGVRAAIFESGITAQYLSCRGTTGVTYDAAPNPFKTPAGGGELWMLGHSLATFRILQHSAPGAKFYHRYSWNLQYAPDQNYIINNYIKTISMTSTSSSSSPLNANSMAMDDFAFRYPYPTFITTTGNQGAAQVPYWGAYNQISVGNVQHYMNWNFRADTGFCWNGGTQAKNPNGVYNSNVTDREMPYVVAPGISPWLTIKTTSPCTAPTGSKMGDACNQYTPEMTYGTSYSAPLVQGIATDMMGQRTSLQNQPEAVRAIMVLTAQDVRDGNWSDINGNYVQDQMDGNGVVHGKDAIDFAKTMTYVYPNNTPTLKGVWWGQIVEQDFSQNAVDKTFKFKFSTPIPAGKHLRVVLTWNSSPDFNAGVNDLSDLDLYFGYLGGTRMESNIEVVDVPSSLLIPNLEYIIRVDAWGYRHHAGARSGAIPVAMAWGYVTDHAKMQ